VVGVGRRDRHRRPAAPPPVRRQGLCLPERPGPGVGRRARAL